ncbi:MAG: tRNA (N(6)-L-threonylcarbamoyladenosine(37)-C(2))-methylthiotransferase MtaB [Bacteroidota bacterium]
MKFKSIAFHHFGCKVNFAEASALSRKFMEKGVEIKNFHDHADVYVISTCIVTAVAEKKCRAAIRQAHKINPEALIAVIGCFSELKPDELSQMEGVNLVLGHSGKFQLIEELEKFQPGHEYHGGISPITQSNENTFVPSYSSNDRTRSFLKIQDGCDYYCSYCTIPLARGHSRSDTIENVIRNAQEIVKKGIHEIVLTGVNIGDFGRHTGETFYQLIEALNQVEGMNRIRISSIEPDLLTDEIIEFVARSRNFLPHFHLPLQSGCNKILKAMHRKYTCELYATRVNKIKELMPFTCIAADVIVGFPDESDEDFHETYHFLEQLNVSYLHVFSYSKRENTLASKSLNPVSDKHKKERSDLLHRLSEKKKRLFYQQNEGREVNVLWESDHPDGFVHGFSENYIRVKTPYNPELVNRITKVKLEITDEDGTFKV